MLRDVILICVGLLIAHLGPKLLHNAREFKRSYYMQKKPCHKCLSSDNSKAFYLHCTTYNVCAENARYNKKLCGIKGRSFKNCKTIV